MLVLVERASASALDSCIWQHARSPAAEGTGQFEPQQGALIAPSACAIPQVAPTACSASRSASNAKIAFFTEINLVLYALAGNSLRGEERPYTGAPTNENSSKTHPSEFNAWSQIGHVLARQAWRIRKQTRIIAHFFASSTAPRLLAEATMKPIFVFFAFVSLALIAVILPRILPARASSSGELQIEPATAMSCVNRYNSLLKRGKEALIAGDRAGTVHLLLQAKRMLASCPALQDGSSRQATALALGTFLGRVGDSSESVDEIWMVSTVAGQYE